MVRRVRIPLESQATLLYLVHLQCIYDNEDARPIVVAFVSYQIK